MLRDPKERKLWFFFLKHEHGGVFHEKTKAWLVPESVDIDALKATIREYFTELEFVDKMNIPAVPMSVSRDYYASFCELVGVPTNGHRITKSEAKRHYILATKRLHPDLGGDPVAMSDLNVAWQEIERSLE